MNVPSHSWTPFELLYARSLEWQCFFAWMNIPFAVNKWQKVYNLLEITSDPYNLIVS